MPLEPVEERVARRLREARITARLTVREAAAAAGLPDHSIIVRYEHGAARPSLNRLATLAGVYNITLAALLAERDEMVALITALEHANSVTTERVRAMLTPAPQAQERRAGTSDIPF